MTISVGVFTAQLRIKCCKRGESAADADKTEHLPASCKYIH